MSVLTTRLAKTREQVLRQRGGETYEDPRREFNTLVVLGALNDAANIIHILVIAYYGLHVDDVVDDLAKVAVKGVSIRGADGELVPGIRQVCYKLDSVRRSPEGGAT